jgi:hypothetical protein
MMSKRIIELIKKNNRTKQVVKFFLQFLNRPTRYYFSSPYVARSPKLKRAGRLQAAKTLQDIEQGLVEGISLYHSVVSFPLDGGRVKSHRGGITDEKTFTLIREAIHFNGELCQEPPEDDLSAIRLSELPVIKHVVLFGGIMYNNFGHFLLESLARLWSYKHVQGLDPYILFYTYWGDPNYFDRKNYVHQVLQGFGIPLTKILFINEIARIEQLIVPAQKYGYEFCKNPDTVFMDFVRGFSFPVTIPRGYDNAENVYVSRAKLSSNLGKLIGENHFETFLKSCGYVMFYPEAHTVYEQLTVYSRAKQIIFADGGALHACILLPDLKAEVAIISRRRDPVWTPSDIADQFRGYGKPVLWVDGVKDQYQFGMDTWNAISTIDWFAVSEVLKEHGFVDRVFTEFDESEYVSQVKQDLKQYIAQVSRNPRFINFMMELKEAALNNEHNAIINNGFNETQ